MKSRVGLRASIARVTRRVRGFFATSGPREPAGPLLLRAFASAYPRATFVEIGANDGKQHDFLRPLILGTEWSGVMVEPVPYVFDRLAANYGDIDRVALEQAAVGDPGASQSFYFLRDTSPEERERLPDWYDGIGSFDRDTILDHARHIPDVAERLVTSDVQVLSFDDLCAKHDLGHVDVVVIDTEGYDWEVLRRIDLHRWSPRLIVFEHYHLDEDTERTAVDFLADAGYVLFREGFDTFGLHSSAPNALLERFRNATPIVPPVTRSGEGV